MNKNILIISAHPSTHSFNHALAEAYADGAIEEGHTVTVLRPDEMDFDPVLHEGYNAIQELEPDLKHTQEAIQAADHVVVASPVWWGGLPPRTKGLLDRAILPGFGFKYEKGKPAPKKLLKGRSGRLLITTGAPAFVTKLIFRNPLVDMLKRETLGLCGIKTRVSQFYGIPDSTQTEREEMLKKVRALGSSVS